MMINKLRKLIVLAFLLPMTGYGMPLSDQDIQRLNRITFGVNTATMNAYIKQGREKFLAQQLDPTSDDRLPPRVANLISKFRISLEPTKLLVQSVQRENQRIQKLPKKQKAMATMVANQAQQSLLLETMNRHLLRAVYSPAQIKEQLVWFWFNYFNVFAYKGLNRLLIADYEDKAIRPHVLGRFRDLLMATLRHPAMLVYLDNAQNAAGKTNENYARELLELHSLGVDGGYSQQDVQELARILTGVGINWSGNYPRLNQQNQVYYLHENGFEFNPNRHDFGEKIFLGKKIVGKGFAEVDQVIDILASHPATVKHICRKLAIYFVADTPPPELLARMENAFKNSGGNIATVLRVLFESKEFTESLGHKIKDPLHYVVSALRFVYEDRHLSDMQPAINWLGAMDEPLFTHSTPDGYGLTEKDWLSPEQIVRRLEIAGYIASGKPKLTGAKVDPKTLSAPRLENRLYYLAVEPILSVSTKNALAKAVSQQEWNRFLLSSPEFMYH